jgi:hypothetical protein
LLTHQAHAEFTFLPLPPPSWLNTNHILVISSLFGWLVIDGWCWFVLREEYCWLVAGGWFDVREKY